MPAVQGPGLEVYLHPEAEAEYGGAIVHFFVCIHFEGTGKSTSDIAVKLVAGPGSDGKSGGIPIHLGRFAAKGFVVVFLVSDGQGRAKLV